MMRLEVRIVFGHNKFPSDDELDLGRSLHVDLVRATAALVSRVGEGTAHGSVYSQFELLKRDYTQMMRIVHQVLGELAIGHLAKISELPPLSSYKCSKPDYRSRTPLKDCAPPTYLKGSVKQSLRKGPARRLYSGKWCGHGLDSYILFDVLVEGNRSFRVRLPEPDDTELNPPLVMAVTQQREIAIYDSREHNGSVYSDKHQRLLPRLQDYFSCPRCRALTFHLAVGFEIPRDREGPNDTSWFALAAECNSCHWLDVIYDDETQ